MPTQPSTTKHRLYIEGALEVECTTVAPADAAHYLLRVLRLRKDTAVTLFNGDGYNYLAQVGAAQGEGLALHVVSRAPGIETHNPPLALALPLLKGERMDYALQKTTELAVDEIFLFDASRSEVRLRQDRLAKRMKHWQGVIRSASEQSGRTRLPILHRVVSFAQMLNATQSMQSFAFEPTAEAGIVATDQRAICCITGPEGGFDEYELRQLAEHCRLVSFGDLVMRAETAPIVALTLANIARMSQRKE